MRPIDLVRLLITTALLSSHALLSGVVFASPPDPIGVPGIYDDDDADDVVLQVMAMAAVVPRPSLDDGPIRPIVWLGALQEPVSSPAVPIYARHIRAPPAS
jgi:hypothetical protein